MKRLLLLMLLTGSALCLRAQSGMLLPTMVMKDDTFAVCTLKEVTIVSKRTFANQVDEFRFNQLRRNVIIVYPYAKEAGKIFREVNDSLAHMTKKKEQKKFVKEKEKELDELYENSLKNLTVTQGEILVKLISRETGISVYDLIKEFKNPASAFYWNKFTQLYGYSLKGNYDPQQERDIEMIVRSLEGTL